MRSALVFLCLALGQTYAQQPSDYRGWLNQGVQAFKNARYDDAVAAFQQAVNLNPTDPTPHLYLGTAYLQRFIPGVVTPENQNTALQAESEFQRVLTLDANNKVALASIASLM